MISYFIFVQKASLFLENQVCIVTIQYLIRSTSAQCSSFSWLNSSDFLSNYLFYLEAFLSFMPTCFREQYEQGTRSTTHVASTRSSKCLDSSDCAIFLDIVCPNDLKQILRWMTTFVAHISRQAFEQDYLQLQSRAFSWGILVCWKILGCCLALLLQEFTLHKVFFPFTTL